jgi:hypothetical protein
MTIQARKFMEKMVIASHALRDKANPNNKPQLNNKQRSLRGGTTKQTVIIIQGN